jgi:hypothetical protein
MLAGENEMTDVKICHKTLGIEIADNDDIVACGAPCMEDKCSAWVSTCGKVACEGFHNVDKCWGNCEFREPHCRCLE